MAIPMRPMPSFRPVAAINPVSLSAKRAEQEAAVKAALATATIVTDEMIEAREKAAKEQRKAELKARREERKAANPPKEKTAKSSLPKAAGDQSKPVSQFKEQPKLPPLDEVLLKVRAGRMSMIEGSIRRICGSDQKRLDLALEVWRSSKNNFSPMGNMPYGWEIQGDIRKAAYEAAKIKYPGLVNRPFRADDYSNNLQYIGKDKYDRKIVIAKDPSFRSIDTQEETEVRFTGFYTFAKREGTDSDKLESLLTARLNAGKLSEKDAEQARIKNAENEQATQEFIAQSGDELMRTALRHVLEGERVISAEIRQGVVLTLLHHYQIGNVRYQYAAKRKWYASHEAAEEAGMKALDSGLKIGKDAKGEDRILSIHGYSVDTILVRAIIIAQEKAPKPEQIRKKDTTVYDRKKDFAKHEGYWGKAKQDTCKFSHG